jgi:HEPN domain-containing protein
VPDPEYVQEWFQRAEGDLAAARVLSEASDVPARVALAQLQQALEKALKGYLLSTGWSLERTHDLGYLLDEAAERLGDLSGEPRVCEIATQAYREERYPGVGGPGVSVDDPAPLVEEGAALIARLDDERETE